MTNRWSAPVCGSFSKHSLISRWSARPPTAQRSFRWFAGSARRGCDGCDALAERHRSDPRGPACGTDHREFWSSRHSRTTSTSTKRYARGKRVPAQEKKKKKKKKTVSTYVAHILMKLGVRDRVQAVILLYESGVIEPGAR